MYASLPEMITGLNMYWRGPMFCTVTGAARSKLSAGLVESSLPQTLIVPAAPRNGGVSKMIRSGASVQTDVAPLAGNTDVTCSSGTTLMTSSATSPTGTSVPPRSRLSGTSLADVMSTPPSFDPEIFPPPHPTPNAATATNPNAANTPRAIVMAHESRRPQPTAQPKRALLEGGNRDR